MLSLIMGLICFFSEAEATFLDPKIIPRQVQSLSSELTEKEFEERLDYIRQGYTPLFKQLKGKLKLKGKWKSKTPNARATQFLGSWIVEITGGLARRPELTADGFALIVCHEIGHHLGGFPFDGGSMMTGNWAAAEGQADYYSTHVCARKLWSKQTELNASFRGQVPAFGAMKCDQIFMDQQERDLCYRIVTASISVTNTMAGILNRPEPPQLETPDRQVRQITYLGHPNTQCRLDTLFQGSICSADPHYTVIPGKKVRHKESLEAETESAKVSCSTHAQFTEGLRPGCWFFARL